MRGVAAGGVAAGGVAAEGGRGSEVPARWCAHIPPSPAPPLAGLVPTQASARAAKAAAKKKKQGREEEEGEGEEGGEETAEKDTGQHRVMRSKREVQEEQVGEGVRVGGGGQRSPTAHH